MDKSIVMKLIRQATEALEEYADDYVEAKTRHHAECQLAWHHLVDAHNLICVGRLTPDNFLWGMEAAERIDKEKLIKTKKRPLKTRGPEGR